MKLCRFALATEPEIARSGIFHDNRVYETDGENAIAIHDLGKIALLAPIGQPPSFRAFERGADGRLHWLYRNPTSITGPVTEVDAPSAATDLDVDFRLALVIGERGEQIGEEEARSFVLGATLTLGFRALAIEAEERSAGLPHVRSRDLPVMVGPFLVTPDELDDLKGVLRAEMSVNGHSASRLEIPLEVPIAEALAECSQTLPVAPGDLVALPSIPFPAIAETKLGRPLRPGDQLVVTGDGLGALSVKIV